MSTTGCWYLNKACFRDTEHMFVCADGFGGGDLIEGNIIFNVRTQAVPTTTGFTEYRIRGV